MTKKTTKKSPSSKAKAPTKPAQKKAATAARPAKATAGAKEVKPAGQVVEAGPAVEAKAKGTVAATKTSGPSRASGVFQIKLVRSLIGSSPHQRAVVAGLGLRRLNQIVTRKDTREIRGMVAKVPHLVDILA